MDDFYDIASGYERFAAAPPQRQAEALFYARRMYSSTDARRWQLWRYHYPRVAIYTFQVRLAELLGPHCQAVLVAARPGYLEIADAILTLPGQVPQHRTITGVIIATGRRAAGSQILLDTRIALDNLCDVFRQTGQQLDEYVPRDPSGRTGLCYLPLTINPTKE